MNEVEVFQDALMGLAEKAAKANRASFSWGVVTQSSPLRIRRDVDATPLAEAPDNMAGPLIVGDRVFVMLADRRFTILGRANAGLGKRVFPTLQAAKDANLPVGVTVFVSSENKDYVRASTGLIAVKNALKDGTMGVPITNTANFESYPSAAAPTVVRDGNWVQFSATYRAKTANIFPIVENQLVIGRIPDGYRPRGKTEIVCQGSGTERWLCVVYEDGSIYGSRYSGSQGVGAWLPVKNVWLAQ